MRPLLVLCVCLVLTGCTSLKHKCVKLNIGEGGNLNFTAPNTDWFGANLGSITGTGPVTLESCPVRPSSPVPPVAS